MLERAKEHITRGEWVEALGALEPYMEAHPLDPMGLFLLGQIMLETEKQSIAYPIYKLCSQLEPKRPEVWINMGKAAGELDLFEEEKICFEKALKFSKAQNNTPSEAVATQNLATNGVHMGNPDRALYWGKKALELNDLPAIHQDMGFAHLAKFNFKEGWEEYDYGLGLLDSREIRNYQGEPKWDGSRDKRLVIYGEQGLGDQIAFASAIKDARRVSKSVILETHRKLETLFSRSFVLEAHGTYREDNPGWARGRKIDASCSMATIQKYFRTEPHKFPGTRFLVPDPVRKMQWKAVMDSLGEKPKVGIAWTGGVKGTGKSLRSTTLEHLLPLLKHDVEWISLEYKDRSDEIRAFKEKHGIQIHDYPWATQTDDYDDTAALVDELDLVIAVPTSVVHLAGGLAKPCYCIVPEKPNFMFGVEGDSMPYYNSVKLFRRGKDWDILKSIGEHLNEFRRNNPGGPGSRGYLSQSSELSTSCHA